MLLIEADKLKKFYGNRLIIDVENLKIHATDRIGIVGVNGAGKTTLINMLSQRLEPDDGWVKLYGRCSNFSQLGKPDSIRLSKEMAAKFGVAVTWSDQMSGGEQTRFKLAQCFAEQCHLLVADEPTSNLDLEGIELLESRLAEYQGAFLLIAHDRSLLDKLCNKIWELEQGKMKVYPGNYSDYLVQKEQERARAQFEYEQYGKEKKRLQEVMENTRQKVKSMRKAPKRMGNSEARLHKMGNQKAKVGLDRAVKNIESRIKHLEAKEKPKGQELIKLDLADQAKIHSKIILAGQEINKAFGEKVIFQDAEFSIYNGAKVALIGPNGCGKSTLVKMIMNQEDSIHRAERLKIGYFSQDLSILQENLSIMENVMAGSSCQETFARILLARLLFKREDVYKKISFLSGGERVKVSLAKILLQEYNLLILDEPTNYLDLNSLEVVEEALREYGRTLLFISHDRRLIGTVADHIMTIESPKIKMFKGTYEEYLAGKNKSREQNKEELANKLMVIQNRLSQVIGKLSLPGKDDDVTALDREYHELLKEMKRLKE